LNRIDVNSIQVLTKTNSKEVFAIAPLEDKVLFHSKWFCFLVPPNQIAVQSFGTAVADFEKWREIAEPKGVTGAKAVAMNISDPLPNGETDELIRFTVPGRADLGGYMRQSVFNWIQVHFERPEFWLNGLDRPIAVKENGALVGCIGPVHRKVPVVKGPQETVTGT